MTANFDLYLVLAMMYDAHFCAYVLETLNTNYVLDRQAKIIMEAIIRLHKRNLPVSFVAVADIIDTNPELSEEVSDEICKLVLTYDDKSKEDFLKRCLKSVLPGIQDRILSVSVIQNLNKSVELADQHRYREILTLWRNTIDKASYREVDYKMFWEEPNWQGYKKIEGVPTGIVGLNSAGEEVFLDEYLQYRGLGRGHLNLFVGTTKYGKTMAMLNLATYMSTLGYEVDFYSLEMPVDYLKLRGLSSILGVSTFNIRDFPEQAKEKYQLMKEILPYCGELRLYQYPANYLTPEHIAMNVYRDLQAERIVDVVIIDYLEFMKKKGQYRAEWEGVALMLPDLCNVARDNNFVLISVSQVGRAGIRAKGGGAEHISGGIVKVYGADLVCFFQEKVEVMTDIRGNKKERVVNYLDVKYNRYGRKGLKLELDVNHDLGKVFTPSPTLEQLKKIRETKK